ncbi:MAG: hypothetical protein H6555_10260, partial [Lewinellaceae bacterium]|nr:hypothetical protein [Lewinellaceae bacterium]
MVQQEWKIPVLVEHIVWDEKPQFNLRPLFVPYPVVVQPRYQDAVLLFQRDIRRQLLNWQVNRDNLDDLLWYLFNPQREEKTIHYYFQQGSIHQKITYLAIFFQVRNLPVVLLPAMDNTLLLLPADEKQWEPYIHQQVHQYLWGLMQQEGNDFSWGRWEARRKDFITEIPIKVDLEFSPNRFQEEEVPNWLSQLLAPQRFEGQAELYKVGTHLNERYPHQLQRAFLREEWVEKIHHLIFRATPVPLVLVGEEGVGRHTLLEEALYRYLEPLAGDEEETPSSVWLVDPARIIAGMSVVGYWEKRLEAIIAYLRKTSHKQVLAHKMVVDNPVALLRIGRSASGKMTLSDAIKPYLEKRQLPLILLATPSEWDLMQEQDRSFCDLFQVVRIPEPDPTTAVRIVLEERKQLETKQGVTIDISAISQLFFIHRNYLQKQALPGSVIRLLQQLCSKHRSGKIDALVVRDSFSLSSSLQEHIFDPNYLFEEDEAYQYLTRYIVGQEEAVRALADVVNLYKARLQNPTRPISSLLFIGPTGVGKTQAAKVLATYLLG